MIHAIGRPSRWARLLVVPLLLVPALAAAAPKQPSIVRLDLVANVRAIVPGRPFKVAARVHIEETWHVQAHVPAESYYIPTVLVPPQVEGITFGTPSYPDPIEVEVDFSPDPLLVYEGDLTLLVEAQTSPDLAPGRRRLPFMLTFQACDDRRCMPPSKVSATLEIEVAQPGAALELRFPEIFGAEPTPRAEPSPRSAAVAPPPPPSAGGPAAPPAEATRGGAGLATDLFAGRGLLALLGLLYLGGLGLSLTPCVYPLIPITLSFFGVQGQGSTGRRVGLALLYVLGLGLTYAGLGVLAALSGRMFGSFLQQPLALIAVALVMVAMAASMFGLFELRVPALGQAGSSRRGLLGAFSMGVVVGVVAAPCVGPFVVALLAYVAQLADPVRGFWMFFVLSMGLGTPLLALALFASKISSMPQAGSWMVWVKYFFGCILLAMALYFVWPLLAPSLLAALAWALALGSMLFLWQAARRLVAPSTPMRVVQIVLPLVFLVVPLLAAPAEDGHAATFLPYADSLVEQARAEGRPVIIDFAADWCIPCLELERKTFSAPEVQMALEGFVLLRADVTQSDDPAVEALRRRYDILGVPAVIFLSPTGEEIRNQRLVEFEDAQAFLERLSRVRGAG